MNKNILVIDDENLVTKSLQKLINKKGYNTVIAASGQEAMNKLKNADFDLIICDVMMPGIDGIETIKKLRQIQKEKNKTPAPEILITGYANEEKYQNAIKLNIADYLFKPFDTKEFLGIIERNLDGSKL